MSIIVHDSLHVQPTCGLLFKHSLSQPPHHAQIHQMKLSSTMVNLMTHLWFATYLADGNLAAVFKLSFAYAIWHVTLHVTLVALKQPSQDFCSHVSDEQLFLAHASALITGPVVCAKTSSHHPVHPGTSDGEEGNKGLFFLLETTGTAVAWQCLLGTQAAEQFAHPRGCCQIA